MIREGRTDRQELTGSRRRALFAVTTMEGFDVILDLLEEECIQQESNLINVDVSDHRKILGEHAMSKAFWLLFIRFQKRVEKERAICLAPEPTTLGPSIEEQEVLHILDATVPPPTSD